MRVPPEHRHAYEVIDGPCDLFLDLERTGEHWRHGSVLAEAVEAAACTVVAELAAEQRLQVRIDTSPMGTVRVNNSMFGNPWTYEAAELGPALATFWDGFELRRVDS